LPWAAFVGELDPGSPAFILLTTDFTETDRATEKITANAKIVITRYLPLNDLFFNGMKPLNPKVWSLRP
tara:strand:- start:206 stop:412 length:207 start_codon:yes stop_codon:yes gene_type:complete